MKKNTVPSRNNSGLSLIQVRDDREAMLVKMRGKLAGASEFQMETTARRKLAVQKSAFGWGWRIGVMAILVLGNIAYFSSGSQAPTKAKARSAPILPRPAPKLSVNEQALYWAYALYDFDMLKAKFGLPKTTVVDSRLAAEQLRILMPNTDAMTRFTIERYLAQAKKEQ